MSLTLHGYWRSGTSYRTRIALGLKGLDYDQVTHDLRANEQKSDAYRALSPQGLVPAIEQGDYTLWQSPAILEWLEDTYPVPNLLPRNAEERGIVRAMCAIIGCDVHPLNNLRVLKSLKNDLGADQSAIDAWAARWIHEGFAALERLIAGHGADYSYGTTPTLVDCYLIPQVYSAERFGVDLSDYDRIMAVNARALSHPAFVAAHPDRQPDAD